MGIRFYVFKQMFHLKDYSTFLLGGPSASASSCSSSLAGCFLLLVGTGCGGDVGTCDGPGSSLVSMAMRNESMSSFMKSSVGCSVSGLRGKTIKVPNRNESNVYRIDYIPYFMI